MRKYRVGHCAARGYRHFDKPESARAFAQQQSAASWSQEEWTVWDKETVEVAWLVSADGSYRDPFVTKEKP